MSRAIAVLRPEPGNRVTAAAIEARGRAAIRLPLFEARPLVWSAPSPSDHDALIFTSANAVRRAGPKLARLLALPVYSVGEATTQAAQRAGFNVVATGSAGAAELIATAEAAGVRRALHLAGRERTLGEGGIVSRAIPVYGSDALPVSPDAIRSLGGSVALIQSARAGARLAELAGEAGLERGTVVLVAVSAAAARAAGAGWERVAIPADVSSAAAIDAALALAD